MNAHHCIHPIDFVIRKAIHYPTYLSLWLIKKSCRRVVDPTLPIRSKQMTAKNDLVSREFEQIRRDHSMTGFTLVSVRHYNLGSPDNFACARAWPSFATEVRRSFTLTANPTRDKSRGDHKDGTRVKTKAEAYIEPIVYTYIDAWRVPSRDSQSERFVAL